MHYFIHGIMLLEGSLALKPLNFQQGWLKKINASHYRNPSVFALLLSVFQFTQLETKRSKQYHCPYDPNLLWELSIGIHAD